MARTSTIKRLPPAIREAVNSLLDQGRTLDEIKNHLVELGHGEVSRSALGRYKLDVDKIAEKMRESRNIAETLMRNLADAPEAKLGRLNIEMLESAVFTMHNSEDLDVKQVTELSRAVKNLISARSADAALNLKLRDEGRKEAERQMESALAGAAVEAGEKALSPLQALERVKAIYRGEA